MRVLVVDDDAVVADMLGFILKDEGFKTETVRSGEEAVQFGRLYDFDIILLDLVLPDISGYEVIKSLRGYRVSTPILVLSGMSAIDDKVRAFALGADEYMVKPFHSAELVARIHAVVRRCNGHAADVIEIGPLTVDIDRKQVRAEGRPVKLTGKEYSFLATLALHKGVTLSKERLMTAVYGGRDEPELKIIDVFMCKLRRKLRAATGGRNLIETVWGRGYVLREDALPPKGGNKRASPHASARAPSRNQSVRALLEDLDREAVETFNTARKDGFSTMDAYELAKDDMAQREGDDTTQREKGDQPSGPAAQVTQLADRIRRAAR